MAACRLAQAVWLLAMMVPASLSLVTSSPIRVKLPLTMDLTQLVGSNGYSMTGGGEAGGAVAVGDVNGDGMDDVIVGAWKADSVYVVFGSLNMDASLDLTSLDGLKGFQLHANASLWSAQAADTVAALGFSVASADVNGDGISDIIMGASMMGPLYSGGACVVFGRAEFPASLDLSADTLDGTNGFIIQGRKNSDFTGWSVGAGDINGDGRSEVILGAPYGDPVVNAEKWRQEAGQVVVIFGRAGGFPRVVDIGSLGSQGFTVNGVSHYSTARGQNDMAGWSVGQDTGDVNGDGFGDFIIGAWSADLTMRDVLGTEFVVNDVGQAYVVFGSAAGFPEFLELSALNGTNGFTLHTDTAGGRTGMSVDISRDVNGDGINDILVGATMASRDPDKAAFAGKIYVVFGKAGPFPAVLNISVLDGANGFTIFGSSEQQRAGMSVAAAGDVNMDGIADIVVSSNGLGSTLAAAAYVIYGSNKTGFPLSVDLSASLDRESVGISVVGMDVAGYFGYEVPRVPWTDVLHKPIAVAAGDTNGDCISDVIVGTPWRDKYSGGAHVVFGRLPWRCEANYRLEGTCTPGGDLSCVPCRTGGCAAGTFLTGQPCTGWEGRDSMICKPCKTQCPAGGYLNGSCPGGAEALDATTCQPCKSSCGAGKYFAQDCSTGLLTADPGCLSCSTCGSGYYASNACDGTLAQDVTCTKCRTSCDAGHYMTGSCTGVELEDVQCVACTSECAEGSFRTGACNGQGRSDAVQCTPCLTSCQPGHYLAGACGSWNTSASTQDHTCKQCSSCGFGEYLAEGCSGKTHHDAAVCMQCNHTCPQGYYLAHACDGKGTRDTAVCQVIPATPAPSPAPTPTPTTPAPTSAPTPAPTPAPEINVGIGRPSSSATATPAPTSAASPTPAQAQPAASVQVSLSIRMPGTRASFIAQKGQFGAAIGAITPAAKRVVIASITEVAARRRMLLQAQVQVDIEVHYAEQASADEGVAALTEESLNVNFVKQGLPPCIVVTSAALVPPETPPPVEETPSVNAPPDGVGWMLPVAITVPVVAVVLLGLLVYKCRPQLLGGKKKGLPEIVEFTSPFERQGSANTTMLSVQAVPTPPPPKAPLSTYSAKPLDTTPPKSISAPLQISQTPPQTHVWAAGHDGASPVPDRPSEAPAGETAGWYSGYNQMKTRCSKSPELSVNSSQANV